MMASRHSPLSFFLAALLSTVTAAVRLEIFFGNE